MICLGFFFFFSKKARIVRIENHSEVELASNREGWRKRGKHGGGVCYEVARNTLLESSFNNNNKNVHHAHY